MNALIYFFTAPLIFLVSRLPFSVLYKVSDGLFHIIFRLIKYRRKVVRQNLQKSFPEKATEEIDRLEIEFYRFFCDFMVESVKYFTMNANEFRARCRFEDETLAKDLFAKKQSFIGVLGHFGNWEWAAPAFSLSGMHQLFVIYKPLSNHLFDQMIHKVRSRFGTQLIAMQNVVRQMFKNKGTVSLTIFVSDQTPFPEDAVWTTFLHQDTAVFRGAEVMAKKMNLPVVFVSVRREKRGHYLIHTEMLCEKPAETAPGEISKMHTDKLEKEILLQPEIWLWSHRRWKYSRPSES